MARANYTLAADDRPEGPAATLQVGTATGDVVVPGGERLRRQADGAADTAPSSALARVFRRRSRLATGRSSRSGRLPPGT